MVDHLFHTGTVDLPRTCLTPDKIMKISGLPYGDAWDLPGRGKGGPRD